MKTKTQGKIGDIVTPRIVAKAAVILTNAVYFAGQWHNKFAKTATHDEPFHKSDGTVKQIAMMHRGA